MGVKESGCDPQHCPLNSLEMVWRTIINVRIVGALFWIVPLVWESEMLYRFETWSLTLRDTIG
jgi:hypothetical protein